MTIPQCHGCPSLKDCTKYQIDFGSEMCKARINFKPKKSTKPKPMPNDKPEQSFIEDSLDVISDFGKRIGEFFG